MRSLRLPFAVAITFGLAAVSAHGATDEWRGAFVMPKSANVNIVAENGEPVSMYDIGWPATVTRTKGRFLWVQDDGGYSPKRVGGWIYTDDIVKLDGARDHFSGELRDRETAWLYWMRGICWESSGEMGIALVDYQNALRVEPNTRIDDIDIRAGRLIAEEQLLGGRGYYDPNKRDTWEHYFQAAQAINGNRPQLFFDWGYALSQACACTQARAVRDAKRTLKAQPVKSPSANSPATNSPESASPNSRAPQRPLIASRGLESDAETPSEAPAPTPRHKSGLVQPSEKKPAEVLPPVNPQPTSSIANGATEAPAPIGPSPDGAKAAVDALAEYETAETLSPNWWRLPLARAELMLNQCDEESPQGDRVAVADFKPEFLTELLGHHKTWKNIQSGSATATLNMVASRGGDDTAAGSTDDSGTGQPAPAISKPPAVDVIATAVEDFNRAISLNPNAVDAYRDRAEALRLANRMIEAEQSATTACTLCNFREARSLRTLAQICNDSGRFQKASEYALRAAELTGGDEQQRFLRLWDTYGRRTTGETAALVVASEKAGYVASRGGDDEDANAPPKRIEPPPGFISREGLGSP